MQPPRIWIQPEVEGERWVWVVYMRDNQAFSRGYKQRLRSALTRETAQRKANKLRALYQRKGWPDGA